MSLRAYFDTALEKDPKKSAEQRRRALGVTVTKGEEASHQLKQARAALDKLRSKQERRRRVVCA